MAKLNNVRVFGVYEPPVEGGTTGNRFSAAIDSYQAGLYGLGEALTGSDWMRRRREENEEEAAFARMQAQRLGAVDRFADVESLGDFGSYLAGLAIQSSPYIAETLAGGLVTRGLMSGTRAALGAASQAGDVGRATQAATRLQRGTMAGGVAASYPSAVGEILQAQREQTGGEVDLASASALGVPFAGLNVLGIEGALLRNQGFRSGVQALDRMTGVTGGLARAGATGLRTGATEAVAEVGQEGVTQFGRMAVDPQAEFFDEGSMERFGEAAAGGFFLGKTIGAGAGGWRRTPETLEERINQQQRLLAEQARALREQQSRETDLTQTVDTDLEIGLGIIPPTNPYDVGGYVSQFQEGGETGIEGQGGLFGGAAPTADMQADMDALGAAPAAPAATRDQTATQTLRDPRSLFLRDTLGIVPTQPALQLVDAIEQAGIPLDSDIVAPVITLAAQRPLSKKGLEKALQMLDAAVIESRRAATAQQAVAPVVSIPGVPERAGVQPAAAPAVAGLSQGAPVATQPTQVPAAPVAEAAAGAQAIQAPSAPAATQAVGQPVPADVDVDALERQIGALRETRQDGIADVLEAELEAIVTGQPISDGPQDSADQVRNSIYELRFPNTPTGQRNLKIARAYHSVMANQNLLGDMGNVKKAIAEAFGVSEKTVEIQTNITPIVATGQRLGYTAQQVREAFNVRDTRKRAPSEVTSTQEQEQGTPDITPALTQVGVENADGETAGFGLDDTGSWRSAAVDRDGKPLFGDTENAIIEAKAQAAFRAAERVKELEAQIREIEALGVPGLMDFLAPRIEQKRAEFEGAMAAYEEALKPKPKKGKAAAAPAAPAAPVTREADPADVKAATDRWNAAGRDLTKLSPQDLQLIRGRAERFNNTALVGQIDTELASRGEVDAVQEQTAAEVPVQPETGAGQEVGRQVRRAQEPAAEGQALTSQEKYAQVVSVVPGAPAFNDLTKAQQDQITDLANRDQLNLAAVNRIIGGQPARLTRDRVTIDVESRVIDETVTSTVAALPASQVARLESHYGVKSGTQEFLDRVKEDVANYVNKGAEAVAGAIRSIIKAISEGVLAIGVIFNPNANLDAFSFDLRSAYSETVNARATVPAQAEGQMSDLAKSVYERMAPVAKKSGKAFIIADKPNGMIHAFNADGSVIVQDAALYGKDMGDVLGASSLEGGPKITPAGKFTMKVSKWDAYTGGYTLDLKESYDGTGYIAIHAAYTGNAAENRLGRLATPTAADNRISYGCINTSDTTFLNSFLPNIDKFNGGMAFVLPDNQTLTDAMFEGETQVVERDAGKVKGGDARTVDAKEEQGAPTIRRMERRSTKADGIQWEDAPEWREREDGRVVDIVVNGKVQQSFELVPPGLWNAFKGDAQQNLLRNPEPQRKRDEAAEAWSNTLFKFKERGPINGVERTVLETLESGDLDAIEQRARRVDYTQLRPSIVAMLSHAAFKQGQVLDVDTAATFNNLDATSKKNLERLTPDWLLGKAERPTEPMGETPRTGPAPKARVDKLVSSVARGMTRTGGMTDLSGNNVDLTPTTVEALTQVDALAEVFDSYRQMGWGNSLNAVKNWYVTSTPVTWDGVFAMVDGQPSVVLNARVLMTLPEESAWTLRHEIGHAIDQVQHGGNFSAGSLFNVSVTGDRIIPRGQLMQDVVNFRTANPNSELAQHLKYPLDMKHTGRLSVDELRQEVFGQLWAFYSGSQANRDFMEDNLPFVFDYFDQGVNNEVKSTDYESDAGGQAQSAGQQEQAITQAESIEPRPLRSREQVQGVIRAHTRQPRGMVQQNLNRIPAPARGAASTMASIFKDIGGRVFDRAVFTSDLTNRAIALGIESAGRLQRTLAARDFMAREEERSIESILNGYTDLTDSERGTGDGSVNRFLFDSTRSGKWGYGDRADAAMAKRFGAFSGPAKKFIQDIFAHGDRMLQRKKDIVLEATKSEFDAQIAAAKTEAQKADLRSAKKATLKRYETLFKIREGRPYAPIKRTGDYVVIAMSAEYADAKEREDKKRMEQLEADGDHYHVSFTDGKRAGEELRRQLLEQGAFADVQLAERDQTTDELFSNQDALQQLTKLRANVDARVKAGETEASKMLSILNQMYLEALAEGSARKSEMKRRGVDGEVDMIASFAQQGRADANFLASLQYADPVTDALNAMRAEAKTGDRTRKSEVMNELSRRYAESLDVPNNPWLNKLTRLSSIYFLASSPAYYLQNLTQPFMMSVPAMAGVHGYTNANAALFKAYGELGPVMKSAKLMQQLDYSQVPADVRNAINELVNRGRIDIGLETELGEFQVDAKSKLGAKWNQVDKGLRMAVQKGEAINRLSTAIAAYRLEFAKTKDAKKAIDYADRILMETHGDYSRYNAPRLFNTPIGKVALQFRKFQLIQLSWYAKMIKQAYSDPVQRGAALRSLAFGLAHTGVLAGAMGLPGYAAAAWILGALFGDEDEPFDLTDSIRKMIGDQEIADVVLRGVPTLGGADWSGKIGAGNMLSIMPFSNADLTTRSGFYESLGTVFGGASGGMVVRGIDGLGLLANGDYLKGSELLLPKGLGDVIKAYRLGTDGATRRNGDVILPESELSALELAWQAIGIPPAQMTAMYEKQQRVRETEQRFRDRTTSIKNAYTKAIRQGDSANAAKAREDWKNLQDARVRAGLKRQPFSDLVKAPREQMKRERDTKGGIQFSRQNRGLVEDITER